MFPLGTILLGKYRVESVLGQGGMGIVLKVTHLHLGSEHALKILPPEVALNPEVRVRFVREGQAVALLRGEHVTRVIDVGVLENDLPYMLMEYLHGTDLAGEIERRGMLFPSEAVDHVLQACEALAEAHAVGIVHRDIKPSNLFLTKHPDGTPLVKVLDFGIAKAPVASDVVETKTNVVMGTPGYMSPEQLRSAKDVDARTDIWALGVVLYESLTGRRPFDVEPYSAFVLMAATQPPPPMGVRPPQELQAVVLRCLEKNREARHPSIAALAVALAPFARDQRGAAIVVERTSLMLRDKNVPESPVDRRHNSVSTSTMNGRSGVARSHTKQRYSNIALVASIVMVCIVTLMAIRKSSQAVAPKSSTASGSVGTSQLSRLDRRTDHRNVDPVVGSASMSQTLLQDPRTACRSSDSALESASRPQIPPSTPRTGHRRSDSTVGVANSPRSAFNKAQRAENEMVGPPPVSDAGEQGESIRNPSADLPLPIPPISCSPDVINGYIAQAHRQFDLGWLSDALGTIVRALGCGDDDRLHQLAVLYSCAEGNVAAAKHHLAKMQTVPQNGELRKKCQEVGLDIYASDVANVDANASPALPVVKGKVPRDN